jgi:hypothetical protein
MKDESESIVVLSTRDLEKIMKRAKNKLVRRLGEGLDAGLGSPQISRPSRAPVAPRSCGRARGPGSRKLFITRIL